MTEGVIESWEEREKGGAKEKKRQKMKCEVRERCGEGRRAGNIKRETERGLDERGQKMGERQGESPGRCLLTQLPASVCLVL